MHVCCTCGCACGCAQVVALACGAFSTIGVMQFSAQGASTHDSSTHDAWTHDAHRSSDSKSKRADTKRADNFLAQERADHFLAQVCGPHSRAWRHVLEHASLHDCWRLLTIVRQLDKKLATSKLALASSSSSSASSCPSNALLAAWYKVGSAACACSTTCECGLIVKVLRAALFAPGAQLDTTSLHDVASSSSGSCHSVEAGNLGGRVSGQVAKRSYKKEFLAFVKHGHTWIAANLVPAMCLVLPSVQQLLHAIALFQRSCPPPAAPCGGAGDGRVIVKGHLLLPLILQVVRQGQGILDQELSVQDEDAEVAGDAHPHHQHALVMLVGELKNGCGSMIFSDDTAHIPLVVPEPYMGEGRSSGARSCTGLAIDDVVLLRHWSLVLPANTCHTTPAHKIPFKSAGLAPTNAADGRQSERDTMRTMHTMHTMHTMDEAYLQVCDANSMQVCDANTMLPCHAACQHVNADEAHAPCGRQEPCLACSTRDSSTRKNSSENASVRQDERQNIHHPLVCVWRRQRSISKEGGGGGEREEGGGPKGGGDMVYCSFSQRKRSWEYSERRGSREHTASRSPLLYQGLETGSSKHKRSKTNASNVSCSNAPHACANGRMRVDELSVNDMKDMNDMKDRKDMSVRDLLQLPADVEQEASFRGVVVSTGWRHGLGSLSPHVAVAAPTAFHPPRPNGNGTGALGTHGPFLPVGRKGVMVMVLMDADAQVSPSLPPSATRCEDSRGCAAAAAPRLALRATRWVCQDPSLSVSHHACVHVYMDTAVTCIPRGLLPGALVVCRHAVLCGPCPNSISTAAGTRGGGAEAASAPRGTLVCRAQAHTHIGILHTAAPYSSVCGLPPLLPPLPGLTPRPWGKVVHVAELGTLVGGDAATAAAGADVTLVGSFCSLWKVSIEMLCSFCQELAPPQTEQAPPPPHSVGNREETQCKQQVDKHVSTDRGEQGRVFSVPCKYTLVVKSQGKFDDGSGSCRIHLHGQHLVLERLLSIPGPQRHELLKAAHQYGRVSFQCGVEDEECFKAAHTRAFLQPSRTAPTSTSRLERATLILSSAVHQAMSSGSLASLRVLGHALPSLPSRAAAQVPTLNTMQQQQQQKQKENEEGTRPLFLDPVKVKLSDTTHRDPVCCAHNHSHCILCHYMSLSHSHSHSPAPWQR